MIIPLETVYDLALSHYGHEGKIDDKNTTFFVKEIISGYKTLISKTPFDQGSTCELDGIKYLVTECHQRFAQTTYYKGIISLLQPVTVRPDLSTTGNVYTYGVVDYKDLEILSTDQVTLNQDQIRITFKSNVDMGLNYYVDFNNRTFKVQNIDDSKPNLITILAKFYKSSDVYTITLSETAKNLNVGDTYQISAICTENGTEVENPEITYIVDDDTIASISSTGLVTALKEGNTTIILIYNGVSATLSLTIAQVVTPPEEPVYTIELDTTSIELEKGSTYQLNPVFKVDGVVDDNPTVTYTSSSTDVTVNGTGLITGVNATYANITIEYNGVSKVIGVTVTEPVSAYTLTFEPDNKGSDGRNCIDENTYAKCSINPVPTGDVTWEFTEDDSGFNIYYQENSYCLITPIIDAFGFADINVKDSNGNIIATTGTNFQIMCENTKRGSTLSINVNSNKTINVGETFQIVSTLASSNYPYCTYTSSNTTVATVDAKGLITGLSSGNSTITVQCERTKKTFTVNVPSEVVNTIEIEDTITFNKHTTGTGTETYQLNTVCKSDGVIVDNPVVTYSCTDSLITIDGNGLISIPYNVTEGSKSITISWENVTKTIEFIVVQIEEEVVNTIEIEDTITFNKYINTETYQLNPICKRNGVVVQNPTITYSVNDDFMTIDNNGLISIPGDTKEGSKSITLTWGTVTKTIEFIVVQERRLRVQVLKDGRVITTLIDDLETNPTQTYNVTISSKNILDVQIYPTYNPSTYKFSYSGDLKLYNNYTTNTRTLLVRKSGGSSGTVTIVDTVSGKTIGTVNVTT